MDVKRVYVCAEESLSRQIKRNKQCSPLVLWLHLSWTASSKPSENQHQPDCLFLPLHGQQARILAQSKTKSQIQQTRERSRFPEPIIQLLCHCWRAKKRVNSRWVKRKRECVITWQLRVRWRSLDRALGQQQTPSLVQQTLLCLSMLFFLKLSHTTKHTLNHPGCVYDVKYYIKPIVSVTIYTASQTHSETSES